MTPITYAAQADLIVLTADMLRSPQEAVSESASIAALTEQDCQDLLHHAFGSAAHRRLDPSSELTLASALNEVVQCARNTSRDRWSHEYFRLFEGATACPVNQASYVRRDKGAILGDVSGFYAAFGWTGSQHTGERPDHLLCHLEFVGMLLALASTRPNQQNADDPREVAMHALSKFAQEHMNDWLPAFCWQLCEESQLEYFGAVAQWMIALWQFLTDLYQWPVDQPAAERLRPIVDPDSPYECGAPDLVQIQQP